MSFRPKFHFSNDVLTFLRTHMHLGIRVKPIHYSVHVRVHWRCQNMAQNKVIWYKNRKYWVLEQNFHFLTIFFTFLRTHMHLGIPGKPIHYIVHVRVHWRCQNMAQNKVIWYKNRKYWVLEQNIHFLTIFFTFLRTHMHLGIRGKPIHYSVHVRVHWRCQNMAQNKVIWYKNRKYWVLEQNFHFLTIFFTFYRTHVHPNTHRVLIHTLKHT